MLQLMYRKMQCNKEFRRQIIIALEFKHFQIFSLCASIMQYILKHK